MHKVIINAANEIHTADGDPLATHTDLAEEMILHYDWGKLGDHWSWFAVGALSAVATQMREETEPGTENWFYGKAVCDAIVEVIEDHVNLVGSGDEVVYAIMRQVELQAKCSAFTARHKYTNTLRWTLAELLVKVGIANADAFHRWVTENGSGAGELEFEEYPKFKTV